jgi:hypothetical protein
MSEYEATDPTTGKTVTFEWMGENDPTDNDVQGVFAEAAKTTPPEKPSEGVWGSLSKRASNVANEWSAPEDEDIAGSFAKSSGRTFRTLGQVAGGVNDIIGAGITAGAKVLYGTIPEEAQKGFESVMSDVGAAIAPTVKTLSDAYGRGKKAYPELFGDMEAAGNIASLVPSAYLGMKTAQVADKAYDVLKGAVTPARTAEYFDKAIDNAVEYGFRKGIKPTVVGKSDAALTEKFYDNAKTATKEIVERYPENLPKNTEDFSKVVRQAKKDIWEEASGMASEAGERGATVSFRPLRDDLLSVIEAENIPESAKRSAKKVLNEIKSYSDEVNPSVSEDLIAHFNSRTKAYWKDPNPHKADDAVFMERAANILRKTTDESIEAYQGPGWQDLRKRYGAQTAIEKAVTDRANVAARANVKGFFDLTDIFTTGEFISALVTHNPASLARAAAMYSAKKYAKNQNNVDRIVKNMFENIGSLRNRQSAIPPRPPF